jgi:hypothetical protein
VRSPILVALSLMALVRPAFADDTSDCIAASEAAETLRDKHAILEARDKLLVCSRDVCPGPVRNDCLEQRAEVEAGIPSIVLRAKDAHGQDTVDVAAFCDGTLLATQLDGRARPIDPGPHTLRFEPRGAPAIERKLVVSEGEKNRLVIIDLSQKASDHVGRARAPTVAAARPPAAGAATVSIPGLIAGGIGVAAAIPMAIFWISGTGDINQMRNTCAPPGGAGCSTDSVNAAQTKLVIGDVFLGVALVGMAAGAILIVTHGFVDRTTDHPDSVGGQALRVDASLVPGGAFVSAGSRF